MDERDFSAGEAELLEVDALRLYLTEIGQYPLLTKDDEVELAQARDRGWRSKEILSELEYQAEATGVELDAAKIRALRTDIHSGEAAMEQFVRSNLRLVVSVAKRYQSSQVQLLDLIQEGNIGLMHAVELFDWRKGFKFSTYATWWIRQTITRGIPNNTIIPAPQWARDTFASFKKAEDRLSLAGNTRPTVEDLEQASFLSASRIRAMQKYRATLGEVGSLHKPIGEDGEVELMDNIPDAAAETGFDTAEASIIFSQTEQLLAEYAAAGPEFAKNVTIFKLLIMSEEPMNSVQAIAYMDRYMPKKSNKSHGVRDIQDALSLVSGYLRVQLGSSYNAGSIRIGRSMDVPPVHVEYHPPVTADRMVDLMLLGRHAANRSKHGELDEVALAKELQLSKFAVKNRLPQAILLGKLHELVISRIIGAGKYLEDEQPPSEDDLMADLAVLTDTFDEIADRYPDEAFKFAAFRMSVLEGMSRQEVALRLNSVYPRLLKNGTPSKSGYGYNRLKDYNVQVFALIKAELLPSAQNAGALAVSEIETSYISQSETY